MIDPKLLELNNASLPKLNEKIQDNLVVYHLSTIEEYMDSCFQCASESFPEGLKYIGSQRCTPLEQFTEVTRPLSPSKKFELSKSDVYLMKYHFTFRGVKLRPYYIFLPFVNEGGLIFLKGTQYKLTPVIGGKIFNIERDEIYMPTLRIRIGFKQIGTSCVLNDKIIHGTSIYSHLHHGLKKTERSALFPTLLHYILAEFGLSVTMKKFFGIDVKVGNEELDKLKDKGYQVYRSRQIIYNNKRNSSKEVSKIRIAIPEDQYYSLLDNVICTLFYIIDNCVSTTENIVDLDNPNLWLYLLDRFIFKATKTEKKQYDKMVDHLLSIKKVMDPMARRILESDRIKCETIFDLFKYIMIKYQDIIIHNDAGSMYGKEITTTKHLMYNVVYNIFKMMYVLQSLPDNVLNIDKVSGVILKMINRDAIFTVTGHGELVPASIASDCLLFSATGNLISHSKAITAGISNQRSRKGNLDVNRLTHASQVAVGSYGWITKKGPTGRDKINPFFNFGENFTTAVSKPLQKDIDKLASLLNAKKYKRHIIVED